MSCNRYTLIPQENRIARSNARMLYLSTSRYGGDWNSYPHTHTFAELFYVVGGVGQFRIENEYYPVKTGDLVIVNPHVEHTETSLDAQPLEYIVLGVKDLELSVDGGQDGRFCIVSFQKNQEYILSFLRLMLREIEAKAPGYEIVCQDLLDILVLQLMRQTDFSATLTPAHQKAGRTCASIRRHIDAHYKEDITLESLSRIAHVSKYHVVHSFTKEYGSSPMNYLTTRRIEESRQLLQTTDYSLTQIAQILGFSSGSYFSQRFRKSEGVSPLEYRKAHRDMQTAT